MKNQLILLLMLLYCDFFAQSTEDSNVGIHKVNKSYVLDTNVILTNKNLPSLVTAIKKDSFDIYKTKKKIPSTVFNLMISLTDDHFSIANPGKNYRATCTSIRNLPKRQLIFVAVNKNMCILSYYTGGRGRFRHLVIIKYDKNEIVDFWCGRGNDADTVDGVLKHIADNIDKDWGLNTNVTFL